MRTGDWARARRKLAASPKRLQAAIEISLKQEAHVLRNEIVQGITRQAPGDEPIRPLSPLTFAAREMAGFRGTKALLVRADLRNSITVIVRDGEAFVGVPRSARSKVGKQLVDIAQLHEFGGPPVVIPMTPKMRRFLFALLRRAGRKPTGGSGRGVIVTQVPARPFLRPAFNKYRREARNRFLKRIAKQLGLTA